jgi:alpha-galactosidase
VQAHPDWFLPGDKGCYRPDLSQEEAYQYILSEMSRLVETYELAWMKVDYNFELGEDPSELAPYYQRWYTLLDTLRARYPVTFFEGCASGGLRSDLHTLSHFDGHFPSDTVDPIDMLRICQGALLRLPPGRLTSWVVLRSVGNAIVPYGSPADQAPETLVAPGNATWTESNAFSPDFAARVALPGILGFSGDLDSMSHDARQRLRHHVAFYKKWRTVIGRSVAHLLTPPCLKTERTGWAAVQLLDPETGTSLLFAYRLDDGVSCRWFPLRGLQPTQLYRVSDDDRPDEPPQERSGSEWMEQGIAVELPERFSAAVFEVSATCLC